MKQKLIVKVPNGEFYLVNNENGTFDLSVGGDSEYHGYGMTNISLKSPTKSKDEGVQKAKENIIKNGCTAIWETVLSDVSDLNVQINNLTNQIVNLNKQLTEKSALADQFWKNLQDRNKLVEQMVAMDKVQNDTLIKKDNEIADLKKQLEVAKSQPTAQVTKYKWR